MASSTGGGGVEKNVAIVYTIEGVDQAASEQERLAGALGETSEALDESSEAATRAEQATEQLGTAALEAGQAAILTQQRISALAAGLSGLGSALGSESELGSTLGRMGQLAATGVQMGSIFGPGGAVAGGILGAAIPAIQGLTDALTPAVPALREVTEEAQRSSGAAIQMGESFVSAGERMREFLRSVSTAGRRTGLEEINAQITDIADQIERITTRGSMMERLDLPGLRERMLSMSAEAEGLRSGLAAEDEETGAGRRRGGGGRASRESFRSDNGAALRALMVEDPTARFERRGQDAIGFARGLGSDAPNKAQDASLDRLADKQKELHDEQMARIQEQVDAWAGAGQKIGATLYSAFQIAAAGQEDLDVAMVKGFKNLAIQFGGQMINEGIGALLTAVGMAGTLNPGAGAKAAEGAGKIALGVGLGAAGAAVQVPSPNASQASTPRLGPQGGESSGGGGSVIVNMNAPSVITGTRAQLGRELGRALRDSSQRFGRASL